MNLSLSYGAFTQITQLRFLLDILIKEEPPPVVTAHQVLCFTGINLLASYNSSTGEGAAVTPMFTDEGAMLEKLTDLLEFESRAVQVSVPFFR